MTTEKATTYTAGPWEFNWMQVPPAKPVYAVFGGFTNEPSCISIAEVWSTEGIATDEANARLIAAAPDLLEALEYYCAHIRALEAGYFDAHEKARAAIAKARHEG